MKHLFFVAVAAGIFSGTTISVKAQTNVNIERYTNKVRPKNSPKFIEGIEIQPEATKNTVVLAEAGTVADEVKIIKHSNNVSGFAGNIEQCSKLQFKYAMLMDTEVESIANFQLYNFIDDWWGTRYHYGGSDKSGIDCSAFTAKLLSEVYGISVPRTSKDQFKICERVGTEDLVEGDLVFFNTKRGVSHVGLYLGNSNFVHSSVNGGVTISSLNDAYYSRKFISGGRIVLASTQLAGGQ